MVNVSVIGLGLIAEVLIKILLNHPQVKLTYIASDSYKNKKLNEVIPTLHTCQDKIQAIDLDKIAQVSDIVFIAKPDEAAFNYVPKLIEYKKRVIDLGGDFRLKNHNLYKKWYKQEHQAKNLLKKTVYGLPEVNKEKISTATLVANPGCYPVGLILGIAPLLKEGLIYEDDIICDSYSGISGAGRTKTNRNLFIDCHENMFAYDVGVHRHIPEMEQEIRRLQNVKCKMQNVKVYFIPHVAPLNRGILSTIYVRLKKKANIKNIYHNFYKEAPFVNILDSLPKINQVNYTNFCNIGFSIYDDRLIIITAIDNLLKGGAGNAVQNLNIMLGIDEREGLKFI